ncbi:GLE1-domain-containing protein [Myriangium duriaei CBS 260.36]|uniref:mRNA export factor GLE1 n=1 Tax=Myriangium duriaei CBS 260.36 TaxID=1168546 RepID=A0A9P4J4J0_9PEZI|nr:GLE1-domain-containing protein [Myriangium duriaei CBS 260.36]
MAASSPLRPSDVTPRRRLRDSTQTIALQILSSSELPDNSPERLAAEFQKLWHDQDRHQQQHLDAQIAQQAERHRQALAHAAAEHSRIRKNAEIARERVELELERERKRREAEEKDRLEKERQAKVAREAEERRRERDQLDRQQKEQAAKAAEEKEIQASKARLEEQKKKDAEDAARQKREAEEAVKTRAREAAANAAKAREEAQKAAVPAQQAPSVMQPTQPSQTSQPAQPVPDTSQTKTIAAPAAQSSTDPILAELENTHKRYVALHKELKRLREHVVAESKKIPALKTKLGDWRREIIKSMGQLTADKSRNRKPMVQIQSILQESLRITNPTVDVSPYLVSVPHPAPGQQIPYSGVFLYLLNIFAKSVISQFISESSGGAKAADPVGVVAVSIFANPALKLNSTVPLIDILLAKYHVVCPLLFCITSNTPQTTVPGRLRLGWWRDGNSFIDEQRHLERMAGLATGWAALTLRDFSKSKNTNPLANFYYWRAIAGVVNTATSDIGSTHTTVLRTLIDGFVPRFIGFYGATAKAVLRVALVDLPERLRRERHGDNAAVQAAGKLEVLREVLQRDLKLTLTDT